MRRFQKLAKLHDFFMGMEIPEAPDVRPVMVVSSGDATKHLVGGVLGKQVLVAYPEGSQSGGVDEYTDRISTVIFVLEKDSEAAKTKGTEARQYRELLELADKVVNTVSRAVSVPVSAGGPRLVCPPLAGLELESVDIVPELSLFGGWNGYSVELIFR